MVLAGAASGVMGTATAIGGPPMALVWQRNSGARLRGTMSGFFLVGSAMSLVRSRRHRSNPQPHHVGLRRASSLRPLLGYLISRPMNKLLDPKRLRWLAIGVSTLGAVVLIGRELVAMGG